MIRFPCDPDQLFSKGDDQELTESVNLTIKQFMEYQNIGKTKAYELVHDPEFYPAFRIGRKILINLDKLRRWNFDQSMKRGGA